VRKRGERERVFISKRYDGCLGTFLLSSFMGNYHQKGTLTMMILPMNNIIHMTGHPFTKIDRKKFLRPKKVFHLPEANLKKLFTAVSYEFS
jgi:hypothetical protein